MATPTPSSSLLTRKWGPLPVWAWALIGLGVAWAYSKYKADQTAASTASTSTTASSAAEPSSGAPYFLIENNEPPTTTSVNVTPPGTGSNPPANNAGNGVATPVYPNGSATTPQAGYGGTSVQAGEVIFPPVQIKAGQTLASISQQWGDSPAHLQQANPGATFQPNTVIGIPYQVRPGDTVASIASKFGLSVPHLELYLPTNPT